MDKVFFGIASYGTQPSSFWVKYSTMLALLNKYDIDFIGQSNGKSMRGDGNRNLTVNSFLKTKADWLMWVDTDNTIPLGGIRRLLDTQKTLVTGLYYQKFEPFPPVAFLRKKDGTYDHIKDWTRGEIVPIDMAGMGACLCHRSVFEDIQKQCTVLQRASGGIFAIHKSRIYGKLKEDPKFKHPAVTDGVYKEPVYIPNHDRESFPFFVFEYGRSEDISFYELAAQCGHEAWCDTSVECDHINQEWIINGESYRKQVKANKVIIPLVKDYVDVEMEEFSNSEDEHGKN
ncbi:MAG: hypothetical protein GYA36_18395 [Veillonellaceae bacterium]|nr:hypothetical protein [Veillonellaceae bacterium]